MDTNKKMEGNKMNQKDYSEIEKQITLEHEQAEQEKVIDAFRRVKHGKKFSLGDLQTVQKFLSEQANVHSKDRVHSMDNTISLLEHNSSMTRESISLSKKKLKKRGLDLDRVRRQRRIEQEKLRKERALGY